MLKFRTLALAASLTVALGGGGFAQAQVGDGDQLGALAPQNLAKPRPKPPFNLTGNWQQDTKPRDGVKQTFTFGTPYPKFHAEALKAMEESKAAAAAGKAYRDDIGHCYPAALPMLMTRVWPIGMIQMPTAIFMVSAFENGYRVVYLDGRKHTDPDVLVNSYNGESIGHWEGKTLVIDTIGMIPEHHWIDSGLPVSDQFHVVERIRMLDGGKTLEFKYIMTDPVNWDGEWVSTKYFSRRDYVDIPEVECTPDLNTHLPATDAKNQTR
jgi:hypothetical protein